MYACLAYTVWGIRRARVKCAHSGPKSGLPAAADRCRGAGGRRTPGACAGRGERVGLVAARAPDHVGGALLRPGRRRVCPAGWPVPTVRILRLLPHAVACRKHDRVGRGCVRVAIRPGIYQRGVAARWQLAGGLARQRSAPRRQRDLAGLAAAPHRQRVGRRLVRQRDGRRGRQQQRLLARGLHASGGSIVLHGRGDAGRHVGRAVADDPGGLGRRPERGCRRHLVCQLQRGGRDLSGHAGDRWRILRAAHGAGFERNRRRRAERGLFRLQRRRASGAGVLRRNRLQRGDPRPRRGLRRARPPGRHSDLVCPEQRRRGRCGRHIRDAGRGHHSPRRLVARSTAWAVTGWPPPGAPGPALERLAVSAATASPTRRWPAARVAGSRSHGRSTRGLRRSCAEPPTPTSS